MMIYWPGSEYRFSCAHCSPKEPALAGGTARHLIVSGLPFQVLCLSGASRRCPRG